ncbi:hypothetical protein BSKO_13142 [Bryopsis sp. KO-2023]|nr:hypothetical protein BSKO_13142 [Bryopsis sp. KO-2023]
MRPIEQRRLLEKTPLVVTQYDTDDFVSRLGSYFELGFSNAQVKRLFLAYPECLTDYFLPRVEVALKFYLSLGLIRDEVVSAFEQVPSMLGGDFYVDFEPKFVWLEEVVGIDRKIILHDWLVKKPRIVLKADLSKLQENYDVFLANGFSRRECVGIFEEFPELLSGDKFDFQDKMDFLKQELGEAGFKEVLGWPIFFTYSYHRRITMRMAFLKYRGRGEKGFPLQSVLEAGTDRFMRRFARSNRKEYKLFTKEWKAPDRIRKAQERWNSSEM